MSSINDVNAHSISPEPDEMTEQPLTQLPGVQSRWFHNISRYHNLITLLILIFINGLNYIDRWTIASVITQIKNETINGFDVPVNNLQAGTLTTCFIVTFMIFSLPFGYLGDRYKRKWIISIGLIIWSGSTLASSFSPTFWFLLLMRMLVGIGEASYATIAPTIIADMYSPNVRLRALAFFYLVIPAGSALGYIVGATATLFATNVLHQSVGGWKWSLRVTPLFGVIAAILMLFAAKEPPRGASEESYMASVSFKNKNGVKAILSDVWHIVTNKSFIFSTLGFTGVTFTTGALAAWTPAFATYLSKAYYNDFYSASLINYVFGALTFVGGLVGTILGSELSRFFSRYTGKSDMLVCAFGMLLTGPSVYFALSVAQYFIYLSAPLILVSVTLISLNWAPTANILLYVIVPQRRSSAEAVQILLSHILGDALSPILTGLIADRISNYRPEAWIQASALKDALYINVYVAVLSGFFYLLGSLFVERDRANANKMNENKVADGETYNERTGLMNSIANSNIDDNNRLHVQEIVHDRLITYTPSEDDDSLLPVGWRGGARN